MTAIDSTAEQEVIDPDSRLMLAVRDGSAVAFEELMRRYQARVLTLLTHLVGSREPTEDLAQEVFLRVYRARETYEPTARFSTWLFTIVGNVASNALRTRSRRREFNVSVGGDGEPSGGGLDEIALEASGQMPTRQLDKREVAEVVRLAIQSLNERQRMAVLLAKFEEMSYADIAAAMQLTVPAVKSLLCRARSSLREKLEPYLADGLLPPAGERP